MSKVMIAMSGGVDSAVTAHLVRMAGHEAIGATMQLYCPGKPLHPDENGMMIGDDIEDARAVADLIEASFPKLCGKVLINSIGTTIGSHTGPGTVALFFWGDERVD